MLAPPIVMSERPTPAAARLTRVYHLADAVNWPSIQHEGLHSARALMARAGLAGTELERLERTQRLTQVTLPSGALLRDQRPIPATALTRCLVGMSAADWYAMLNARVFFWFDPARLNRQRAACGARRQVVLTVDAVALVAAHRERVAVTPINTGNARRNPAARGAATFVPYACWAERGWASEAEALGTRARPRAHAPVELTVLGSVPDALTFVTRAEVLAMGEAFAPRPD